MPFLLMKQLAWQTGWPAGWLAPKWRGRGGPTAFAVGDKSVAVDFWAFGRAVRVTGCRTRHVVVVCAKHHLPSPSPPLSFCHARPAMGFGSCGPPRFKRSAAVDTGCVPYAYNKHSTAKNNGRERGGEGHQRELSIRNVGRRVCAFLKRL
jgi:hypothetical protein